MPNDIHAQIEQAFNDDFDEVEAATLDMWKKHIKTAKQNTFKDHRGRPGKVGGSLPRGAAGGAVVKTKTLDDVLKEKLGLPDKVHDETILALTGAQLHGRLHGTERLIGMDEEGQMIFSRDGTKDRVSVDGLELNKAFITVHNHPSSSVFSVMDLHVFNDFESQRHMAVIGHNGDIFLISKPEGWKALAGGDAVYDVYNGAIADTTTLFHQTFAAGATEWQANRVASLEAMDLFEKKSGLDFQFIEYGVDYGTKK